MSVANASVRHRSASTRSQADWCASQRVAIDERGLGPELLRRADGLDHRLDLALQVVALVDHVRDVGGAPLLPRDTAGSRGRCGTPGRGRSSRASGRRRRSVRSLKWKPPSMLLVEQPRDDLLDVLPLVVMARVDEHVGLRPGVAREQQRHAPVGDVGVVEGRLERLVLDEQPLRPARDVRAPCRALRRTSACACGCAACPGSSSRRRTTARGRATRAHGRCRRSRAGARAPRRAPPDRGCRPSRACSAGPGRGSG